MSGYEQCRILQTHDKSEARNQLKKTDCLALTMKITSRDQSITWHATHSNMMSQQSMFKINFKKLKTLKMLDFKNKFKHSIIEDTLKISFQYSIYQVFF
jgi:hypothetical protein